MNDYSYALDDDDNHMDEIFEINLAFKNHKLIHQLFERGECLMEKDEQKQQEIDEKISKMFQDRNEVENMMQIVSAFIVFKCAKN